MLTPLAATAHSRGSHQHYLNLDTRVTLGLLAMSLCTLWTALARIAYRDFSWRQRAGLALHARGAQERVRQRQAIVNSLFLLVKLVATCIALGVGLIVSHAARCSKMRNEVAAAAGVLGVHAVTLMALYSLFYSARYARSRRRPLALAASGLPCVTYLFIVALRLRHWSCRTDGEPPAHLALSTLAPLAPPPLASPPLAPPPPCLSHVDDGSDYLRFVFNLQVAVALCAVVFQVLLLYQTIAIVRYRTARERELVAARDRGSDPAQSTSVPAGIAADAAATTSRRTLRILGSDAALDMPLPAQYRGLGPRTESSVRATLRGREMLLHMPSKRFSEKRFMQLDIVLNTLRWSWKDYIGLDQIEVHACSEFKLRGDAPLTLALPWRCGDIKHPFGNTPLQPTR